MLGYTSAAWFRYAFFPLMPDHAWNWTTCEVLPSRLGAESALIERLLEELARSGWSDRDQFGIRLAVEEALVNAIKHGNQLQPDKQVRVQCKLSNERFWIDITDQGSGFNPQSLPDPTAPENLDRPSGRGVLLMQSFMSHVEFNDIGNRVIMEKIKDAPPLSPCP